MLFRPNCLIPSSCGRRQIVASTRSTPSPLQNVSEVFILHIRKILIDGVQAQASTSHFIPFCVFSSKQKICYSTYDHHTTQTDAAPYKSCMIFWPRGGAKNLGTNHIPNAIPNEGSSADCSFLCSWSVLLHIQLRQILTRMSCHIRCSQGDGQSACSDLYSHEEDTRK